MPLKDPAARAEYHRKYMAERYKADPEFRVRHKARVAHNRAAHKTKVAALIGDWRRGGCAACTEKEPCCVSAHRLDPKGKDFSLGNAARQGFSLKRVAQELEKCVCLCENCHRKVHAGVLELLSPEKSRKDSENP